jgi:hypothetical protein
MLGVKEGPTKGAATNSDRSMGMPEELRVRLLAWIDVTEVGADGFWIWLGTLLPLLPDPVASRSVEVHRNELSEARLKELARDLADCARERARLNAAGARYFADNQALARRMKALEEALARYGWPDHPASLAPDAEAARAANRYLPRG